MHLSGSITALATPFTAGGEIDSDAWLRLLDGQLAGGTSAVVVAGSTGEAAALDEREYVQLISSAVDRVGASIPVLAGTGLSSTARTIAQTRLAREAGAALALVVTPPYVRPTQAGLVVHYRKVAEEGGLPVVLYNVPGRTGCDMLPETVAQLAAHPGIVGLKEARADEPRWQALYPLASPAFALLSGDDPTCVRAMREGAAGVVSVASNVLPRSFSSLCRWLKAGRVHQAVDLDRSLQPVYEFLGVESNPIPVKAVLQRLGIGQGLRLPLLSLSAGHAGEADRITQLCRDLESQLQ